MDVVQLPPRDASSHKRLVSKPEKLAEMCACCYYNKDGRVAALRFPAGIGDY
jgi:hypothetical protein